MLRRVGSKRVDCTGRPAPTVLVWLYPGFHTHRLIIGPFFMVESGNEKIYGATECSAFWPQVHGDLFCSGYTVSRCYPGII